MKLALLPVVLALFVGSPFAQAPVPRDPIVLADGIDATAYRLAREGDRVVVAYTDEIADDGAGNFFNTVFVQVSEDGGLTFAASVEIPPVFGQHAISLFEVAVSGEDVHVVWVEPKERTGEEAFATVSRDGGRTFSTPIRLDDGVSTRDDIMDLQLALVPDAAGDRIYVAMRVGLDFITRGVKIVSSHDGGASFGSAVHVWGGPVGNTTQVHSLCLSADDTAVHVAWVGVPMAYNLFYQRSVDEGATFLPVAEKLHSDGSVPFANSDVRLALDGARVVAAWQAQPDLLGRRELFLTTSVDGGATWSAVTGVGGTVPGVTDVSSFDIHLEGDRIVAAWSENRDQLGYRQLFVARSTDLGVTFVEQELVYFEGGWLPDLEGQGDDLVLGFEGGFTAQYGGASVSVDGGASWSPAVALTAAIASRSMPTLLGADPAREDVVTVHERAGLLTASGFSTCDDGEVLVRNAGANPASLSAGVPLLGTDWTVTVDLGLTGHTLGQVFAYVSPLTFTLPGGQVVLVNPLDPAGELLQLPAASGDPLTFTVPVPNVPSMCGQTASFQAVHFGGVTPFALSNALDITAAAF